MTLVAATVFVTLAFAGGGVPVSLALVGAAFALNPFLGCAFGAGWIVVSRIRRAPRRRQQASADRMESVLAIELVAQGVAAGMSFDNAVATASDHVNRSVRETLRSSLRLSRVGISGTADGDALETMFDRARAAAVSGAPLAVELTELAASERRRVQAERAERLERLPIKLLFPLAFLILPGFLLVAVVPAVIGGIARLTL